MTESTLSSPPVQETDFSSIQNGNDPAAPAEAAEPVSSTKKAPRALGPDLLRGFIIILQALDHAAVSVGAWPHGLAVLSESDGQLVDSWNSATGWTARMLTHLCAPGFLFLLGMGVVYFGTSRTKLGWSNWRMSKHFFVRCAVLILVCQFLSFIMTGTLFIILNIVLYALAIDYFLTGIFWLALNPSEKVLAKLVGSIFPAKRSSGEAQPLLLESANDTEDHAHADARAKATAFHTINTLILGLSAVTIWWNIWLSPDKGHCNSAIKSRPDIQLVQQEARPGPSIFAFFFYIVQAPWLISPFPPLAWISFALLGVLYARLLLHYKPRANQAAIATALAGTIFAAIFVLTRIFHFGNLTEDCLHMPENLTNLAGNQYLVSFRAFFYIAKYPPDVAYLCYTMSVNMWLLTAFTLLPPLGSNEHGEFARPRAAPLLRVMYGILLPFGQCALFFYTAHITFYMLLGRLVKNAFGHDLPWYDQMKHTMAFGVGNSPIFWVYYFTGLVVLWFACRWYAGFKASKGPDSVWRFF